MSITRYFPALCIEDLEDREPHAAMLEAGPETKCQCYVMEEDCHRLSPEVIETIRKTLRIYNTQLNTIRHLPDTAPRDMDAIECALAELAALPVRGDGGA